MPTSQCKISREVLAVSFLMNQNHRRATASVTLGLTLALVVGSEPAASVEPATASQDCDRKPDGRNCEADGTHHDSEAAKYAHHSPSSHDFHCSQSVST